ncbi:hypothetical protein ACFPJ4_01615 [Lysinimonas soli]|uniref:SDR family NAD(P)-dependent oxidoreductase n=1 Tax=Lysinimonas soli TaxID=1074233 RepID=A0ABW0NKJ6_9MICO
MERDAAVSAGARVPRLRGCRLLVTAGDSIASREVILALVREGADVAISYPADQPDAAEVTGALARAAGTLVALVPGDTIDRGVCERLIDRSAELLGGLDALVVVERVSRAPVAPWTTLIRAAASRLRPGASILVGSSSIDRDLLEQLRSSGIRLARIAPPPHYGGGTAAAYLELAMRSC